MSRFHYVVRATKESAKYAGKTSHSKNTGRNQINIRGIIWFNVNLCLRDNIAHLRNSKMVMSTQCLEVLKENVFMKNMIFDIMILENE